MEYRFLCVTQLNAFAAFIAFAAFAWPGINADGVG